MIKYTDIKGKSVVICDHCRGDIQHGATVISIAPGSVTDGFIVRDYNLGEIVFCPTCARNLGTILDMIGARRSHGLGAEREAA